MPESSQPPATWAGEEAAVWPLWDALLLHQRGLGAQQDLPLLSPGGDRISSIEDLQVVSVCVWRILNQSSQKNKWASVLPANYQSMAVLTKFCFEYLLFVCHDKYRSEKMKEHSITDTNGLNRWSPWRNPLEATRAWQSCRIWWHTSRSRCGANWLLGFKITFGCNAFTLLQESERLAFGITDNLIRVSVIQSWLKRDGYETTEVSCNYAMMVAPTLSVRQLF